MFREGGAGGTRRSVLCAWARTPVYATRLRHAYAPPPPPPPAPAAQPSCTRSAGALCERACGMSFTCRHQRGLLGYPLGEVVGRSATLLQCSRGPRSGMLAMACVRAHRHFRGEPVG